MQKKIIAAAVAGLLAVPAFAQSNVTISGLVKAGWEQYKLSGATGGGWDYSNENRVSDQSSRVIISATEDLGGGLKAWFQVDSRYANDTGGGTLGSGNTGVGLMGNWGKFTIGRWDLHYGENGGLESNRAGSLQTYLTPGIMSQVNGATVANGTRTNNVLMYDTPNWNGFTGRLAWVAAGPSGGEGSGARATGVQDPGGGKAWTMAARYAAGPWAAGLSYWNNDAENKGATGDQRGTRAWFGYNAPMGLKIGLVWDRSKISSGPVTSEVWSSRSAWLLPVSYSFGPHAVYFAYAKAGNLSGSAVPAGTDAKGKAWSLGYDYAFSKRTSAGVYYTKLTNNTAGSYDMFGLGASGATATIAGEDAKQLYIGMAHSF